MLVRTRRGVWRHDTNLGSGGSGSPGAGVTTGAAETTKGSPTELIASTAFDAYWVTVGASQLSSSSTSSAAVLDILIGAATEQVLIPDILCGGAGTDASGRAWSFPLYVPAGSRLSARAASERTSTTFRVWVNLMGGDVMPPFRVGEAVTAYGIGTTPQGTAITVGASGAEGAWTEITASTSRDHFFFVPSFHAYANTTLNNRNFSFDLGVGAATEQEILGPWVGCTSNAEEVGTFQPGILGFYDVPAGSRLSLRGSNHGTDTGGNQVALYAVS